MATTTNYGWTTPDDTALVKDGAAAIRSLGTSIDTTTKNLNPSTTLGDIEYRSSTANVNTRLPIGTAGQVLKVNSGGTAPEWATDATGMTNPMTTTGDTIYSSSGSTPARLAIGSTGNVLTVSGGVPTWSAPAGAYTLLSTNTITSGVSSYSVSSIDTTYKHLHIFFRGVYTSNDNIEINLRFNGITTISYNFGGFNASAYSDNETTSIYSFGVGTNSSTQRHRLHGDLFIPNYTTTGVVNSSIRTMATTGSGFNKSNLINANFTAAAAISQITLLPTTGTLSGGTILVYGVN